MRQKRVFPYSPMNKNSRNKLTPLCYTREEHENTFQEQFCGLKKLSSQKK